VARRLIFHIGMPRAGSSTLQEVLYLNRTKLFAAGILYPAIRPETVGTDEPSALYNHKILQQSARLILPIGLFKSAHDDVTTDIRDNPAETTILSYEGWWHPGHVRHLARTASYIRSRIPGLDVTIFAMVRQPAPFLRSLYKLDVLHGRTDALFDDYWPSKLADPRLRYNLIAKKLESKFGKDSQFLFRRFEDLAVEGRLVGNIFSALGAGDVLRRSGLEALERHKNSGNEIFSDPFVSLFLHQSRRIGLAKAAAMRMQLNENIREIASYPALHAEMAQLAIPCSGRASAAINAACQSELAGLGKRYFEEDLADGAEAVEGHGLQSVIAETSPIGRALADRLKRL